MAVESGKASKGFYFSFDAFLALTIMVASLSVVAQSSSIASDPFRADSIDYRQAGTTGQDAVKLASSETFYSFNSSFQQELLDETVMDEEDLERDIMDGISLLWAARNFTYAENVAENYFGSKTGVYEYRIQVNEGGTETVIHESSEMDGSPEIVSSASRLVSGHRIDEPSEGFQARARATELTTNETEVYSFPPMGGAREGGDLRVSRQIDIESVENVVESPLYLSIHYGCSNADFQTLRVNGMNIKNEVEWLHQSEQCDGSDNRGTAGYGLIEDVSPYLEDGLNNVTMWFQNPEYGAYTHPGMRLELNLEGREARQVPENQRSISPFNDMIADEQANRGTGGFALNTFEVPQGSEIEEAEITLRAENIDREYENYDVTYWDTFSDDFDGTCIGDTVSDVMVYFNGEQLHSSYAPEDGTVYLEFDVSDQTREGTNVVTTYLNSFADCTWGTDETHIIGGYSDPENYSRVNTSYETGSEGGLVFGMIDVTQTRMIGGDVENPKTYEEQFEREIQDSFLHIGSLFSSGIRINVDPEEGFESTVFESGDLPRAVPSKFFIDPSYYTDPGYNTIEMEDPNTVVDFVPESSLERTVRISSQVGYGNMFDTRADAVEDAQERLENELGEYADAASIETDDISTGAQPYLWGPASVKLVVWRE